MNTSTVEANRTPLPAESSLHWILLCSIAFAWLPGIAKSEALNLTRVAPGLYVHEGHQAGLSSPQRDDIANIGFIIGERCAAVIDTGGSVETGRRLRNALRRITAKPVCYIVNTHVHYDHLLGNAAFLSDPAKFVGHRNLVAAVDNNRAFFLDSFASELGSPADSGRIKGPDITVGKSKVLDLGDRKIKLTAHQTAHTDSDLSVLDMKTNTLWISDLLFVQRVPAVNGSIQGWIDESEKLAPGEYTRIIPGHGPVPEDWHAAVSAQTRYLKKLRREIRSIIQNGGFLEDALRTVGQSEKDHWLLFEEDHRRNVTRAFAELEWE